MKRNLLLATGAFAWCFATACNGALTGDDGSDSTQGAIGTEGTATAEKANHEAAGEGEQRKEGGALDPCPNDKPDGHGTGAGKPGHPGKPGEPVPTKPGEPGTEKPELPPPSPESCTWTAVGDGSTCISHLDLKLNAVAACGTAQLRSIHAADDCANGTTIAKVECCSVSPTLTKANTIGKN